MICICVYIILCILIFPCSESLPHQHMLQMSDRFCNFEGLFLTHLHHPTGDHATAGSTAGVASILLCGPEVHNVVDDLHVFFFALSSFRSFP